MATQHHRARGEERISSSSVRVRGLTIEAAVRVLYVFFLAHPSGDQHPSPADDAVLIRLFRRSPFGFPTVPSTVTGTRDGAARARLNLAASVVVFIESQPMLRMVAALLETA